MRTGCIIFVALAVAGCGLRKGGKRLPDGGTLGTDEGCNRAVADGNRVLEGADLFANVSALQFDPQGNLYVLSHSSTESWISVFGPAPDNDWQQTRARGLVRRGVDLVRSADGTFWVLDHPNNLDPVVMHLTPQGIELGRFTVTSDEAGGLALSSSGTLYGSFGHIAKFDADGGVAQVFGDKDPYIPYYQGMVFDAHGVLWATELTERTVEEFDFSGGRLASFGGHGTGPGMFDGTSDVHGGPSKIAIDSTGDLYVNDPLASRMMKLSRQGSMLGQFGFEGSTNVDPIAVDPTTGNVYVGRGNGVDIVCPL